MGVPYSVNKLVSDRHWTRLELKRGMLQCQESSLESPTVCTRYLEKKQLVGRVVIRPHCSIHRCIYI